MQAVRDGRFTHLRAPETIDDGIEILTGVAAGVARGAEPLSDGHRERARRGARCGDGGLMRDYGGPHT